MLTFESAISSEINGTYLVGTIDNVSYKTLVSAIGNPNGESDGYKTDVEWWIRFEDGTIATIYNWKNGRNYDPEYGLDIKDIQHWNIGGQCPLAVTRIRQVFGELLGDQNISYSS